MQTSGGDIPVLLNQPAILPGHSLSNGRYQLSAQVDPDGRISGNASFGELVAKEPLAVREFKADIKGKVAPDGLGFEFAMPIVGTGKTGETDGLLRAGAKSRKKRQTIARDGFQQWHVLSE